MSTENIAVGECFGERLKALRKNRGLKASDLADRLGVSRGYLSDLEAAKKRNPSAQLVQRIARELGASLDQLGATLVGEGSASYTDANREQIEDQIKCVLAEGPRGAARRMDLPELFARIRDHASEATGNKAPYMAVAHAEIIFHLATELWDRLKTLQGKLTGEEEEIEEEEEELEEEEHDE